MTSDLTAPTRESVSGEMLTFLQFVNRAAVRTLGLPCSRNIKVDLRVVIPKRHVGERTWAIHTALVIQVFGEEFDG